MVKGGILTSRVHRWASCSWLRCHLFNLKQLRWDAWAVPWSQLYRDQRGCYRYAARARMQWFLSIYRAVWSPVVDRWGLPKPTDTPFLQKYTLDKQQISISDHKDWAVQIRLYRKQAISEEQNLGRRGQKMTLWRRFYKWLELHLSSWPKLFTPSAKKDHYEMQWLYVANSSAVPVTKLSLHSFSASWPIHFIWRLQSVMITV